MPFSSGMVMSRIISSGFKRSAASTKALPSATVPTISMMRIEKRPNAFERQRMVVRQ